MDTIVFDDANGESMKDICWFAPLYPAGVVKPFENLLAIKPLVSQYVLLLPAMVNKGTPRRPNWGYRNMYYGLGHDWTERVRSGAFLRPDLSVGVFEDWLEEHR